MDKIYYNAKDVAELLGISKSKAYQIIKQLNMELQEKGFLILQGKISVVYFQEKIYGMNKQSHVS